MPEVWFTADTHFGHNNVIRHCQRPFLAAEDLAALAALGGDWDRYEPHRISDAAIAMMNDAFVASINRCVEPGDTLYHLGDVLFARKPLEEGRRLLDRIRCRNIHLVWGNHDDCKIAPLFLSASDLKEIKVDGQRIVLCHYAMAVWNKSHRGSWHLYGHSHGDGEAWLDEHMPGRRSMDVGVDNACRLLGQYRPFSFAEVRSLLEHRPGYPIDHHIGDD